MQYRIISSEDSDRLIIFFAGWGMDEAPFANISRPGYDVVLIWDYESFDIDWSFTSGYNEICIIAWSFGVYAASVTVHAIAPKITRSLAVNGTLYPCDRRRGIPPAIFEGTINGLNERNMAKFYRRMCGSAQSYAHFCEHMPSRGVDSLHRELLSFHPDATLLHQPVNIFDFAIIGRDDAIIPAVNQWRAWARTPKMFVDAPHLMDFRHIIDHFVVDKLRVGQRFTTGLESYDTQADVQSAVVEYICTLMQRHGITRRMAMPGCRVLEIGCGTGCLSRRLDTFSEAGYLEMWDIAAKPCLDGPGRLFRQTDAETEIRRLPSQSFDIIASASTMQWFNSPVHFLRQCLRVLFKGGYAVLSTFETGNLAEVSAVTGRSLPLMDLRQWRQAIPDAFDIIDIIRLKRTLTFDSAIEVFRHLKATGVNALGRTSDGESSLHGILQRYRHDLDGKYHITYRPIIFILRKK